VSYSSFYEDKWFLYSNTSAYFTPFKSDFVNMTLDNYSQVKIANSKTLLFIVISSTILIEHKFFDSDKGTTKITMLKL